MRPVADESGFTLIELLVTCTLLIIVLGATLSIFESFAKVDKRTQEQNDATQQARRDTELMAKELRNLASPSTLNPQAVEKATDYDLVFETIQPTKPGASLNDRNLSRVRYCLGASSAGKASLWKQTQTWTSAAPPETPATTSCPSGAWPSQTLVSRDIVNRDQGTRPIWIYNDTVLDRITSIRTELNVDAQVGSRPQATRLESGVFLRNQNRAPLAAFTATDTGTAHRLLLNGSASEDPEGNAIVSYVWYANGNFTTPIATGVVAYWTPPGASFPQTHQITLRVKDAGGREDDETETAVVN